MVLQSAFELHPNKIITAHNILLEHCESQQCYRFFMKIFGRLAMAKVSMNVNRNFQCDTNFLIHRHRN